MKDNPEQILHIAVEYKGCLWNMAAIFIIFAVLAYLCRSVITKKYRYLQKRLADRVVRGAVVIAALWLVWKKDIAGMLLRVSGLSEIRLPLLQRLENIFYERISYLSVTAAFILSAAVYIVYKGIWLLWQKRLLKKREFSLEGTEAYELYEYKGEASQYVLKSEFVPLGSVYQVLFLAEGLFLGLAKYLVERTGSFQELLVMAAALCLYTWERLEYYTGDTLEEYKKRGAQNPNPDSNPNMEALEFEAKRKAAEEKILEIQCSGDYRKRCMGYDWYRTLKDNQNVHIEYMEAALLLAEHRSVYFPHIFYKELGAYLFPFFALELLEGGKLFLVSGAPESEEELESWLVSGLSGRCKRPVIWRAGERREIGGADIGIVSVKHLKEAAAGYDNYGFFRRTAVVVFLGISSFAPSHPVMLSQLLARLQPEEELTYLVCDWNGTGMADWLSHICKAEITAAPDCRSGKEGKYVLSDLDAEPSGEAAVKTVSGVEGEGELAEDMIYNAAELLRQYRMRGSSLTTVRSPHYMLRNFMISGMELGKKPAAYQLLPEFVRSERNMAIAAGYRLIRGGTEWAELKKLLDFFGSGSDTERGIEELLGRLNLVYTEVLGLTKMWAAEDLIDQKEQGERRIVISTEEGRQQFSKWYQENIDAVVYEREGTAQSEALTAGGHLYQYYLPGQLLMLEGKYYRAEEILQREGRRVLRLRSASDSVTGRRYYRQVRRILLKEDTSLPAIPMLQQGEICVELCYAELTVTTEGQLCCRRFYDLKHAERMPVSGIPQRVYRKKAYLRISAKHQNRMWAGILLKELFYTLFPYHWQLLSVAVPEKLVKEELWGRIDMLQNIGGAKDEKDTIYIIEDSPMDLGLAEAIGRHFEQIMSLMNQYADWGNREGKEELKKYFGDELLDMLRFSGIR